MSITSSRVKAVYVPKDFIQHAASHGQAFAHCQMFLTAATRRCMGRVSVPSVGVSLSAPLRVVALVGRYPTNKLMRHRPLKERIAPLVSPRHLELPRLSTSYARLFGAYLRITTSSAGAPTYY
jgi:hypothetical protein